VIGDFGGFAPADARTSAILVCKALRDLGANVSTEPVDPAQVAPSRNAYRTDLHKLGSVLVLDVDFEAPVGTRARGRSLQLNGVEEVSVAAPRIAESLLRGTPVDQTAKVQTLVGGETRSYPKQYGETKVGIGVLGFALPGDTFAGYGIFGRVYYEAARYAVGLALRFGTSSSGEGDASLIDISVGARYFLNEADTSPFVGGGVGILWLGVDRTYTAPPKAGSLVTSSSLHGSGFDAFGEVGVEFLRMHGARFDALLRLDAPMFSMHDAAHRHYTLPIALMASYSFD
jgi:hypothetical protein